MGIGKDFAKKMSPFIKPDENGVIEGVFENIKEITKDSFGKTITTMRYLISGKQFDSASGSLASQMDAITPGQKVRITKSGSGMQTKYKVEVIG